MKKVLGKQWSWGRDWTYVDEWILFTLVLPFIALPVLRLFYMDGRELLFFYSLVCLGPPGWLFVHLAYNKEFSLMRVLLPIGIAVAAIVGATCFFFSPVSWALGFAFLIAGVVLLPFIAQHFHLLRCTQSSAIISRPSAPDAKAKGQGWGLLAWWSRQWGKDQGADVDDGAESDDENYEDAQDRSITGLMTKLRLGDANLTCDDIAKCPDVAAFTGPQLQKRVEIYFGELVALLALQQKSLQGASGDLTPLASDPIKTTVQNSLTALEALRAAYASQKADHSADLSAAIDAFVQATGADPHNATMQILGALVLLLGVAAIVASTGGAAAVPMIATWVASLTTASTTAMTVVGSVAVISGVTFLTNDHRTQAQKAAWSVAKAARKGL